jgi:hypothetical protein
MAVARNVAIVLALAALVAFLPAGGTTANVVGAVLSTLIIVSLVYILARLYRERRLDLEGLGDRWRGVLYGSIATVLFAMAARERLFDSGAGTIVWFAALGGASYALYLVWSHYREYA